LEEKVNEKMQKCLDHLGVPLTVAWIPSSGHDQHGQLKLSSRTLFIFDLKEEEAWQTFVHEVLEFRLKDILGYYRKVINGLIEIIEKLCYEKKEEFLEFIPQVFEEVKKVEQKT
jgi:hypothetical protein